jgi:hypothetical protein
MLSSASQLWILSARKRRLNSQFLKAIYAFFHNGGGLFLCGDNRPFYKDANVISSNLFGVTMSGDIPGRKKVMLQRAHINLKPENGFKRFMRVMFGVGARSRAGIVRNHEITTGLQILYEGSTIATIKENKELTPILYGSAGNLVTACYDKLGKRAVLDGGYTRLYIEWDTAGTARFVKNVAAWLANVERAANENTFEKDTTSKSERYLLK